ncbi:polyphosphate polymerase domain-containing protein [Isoptericola sp. NEAU-Y5]|uniref:Polyphosphate polymerase domain-containing protein n=1 Tax=Isoptericola luteus TaxID=2879484 RepID=A0ABS7ZM53_9MICO|nr:polyphosphate polymerase domain-containing protein [Isoptericola sp. NEAU-Y5]MCA5894964.1 polyphosphate polymerase domain-containing protein [Isoptericola sp. NEAU-Y5]
MSELGVAVHALEPISLTEMNARARLLTRVDRKYFVPRAVLAQIVSASGGFYRALEIDGRREFRYDTVYFDSPRFDFFRAHVQGRRHRYKVRTRTYRDSGDCLLEVKSKGYRGQTVKERVAHDADGPLALGAEGSRFVGLVTGGPADVLRPVVSTTYHRVTLTHGDQRVTCDLDLIVHGAGAVFGGPDDVLVETKSPGGAGRLDRALLECGVRPHRVSKYCVGVALCYPHLPHNPWQRTLSRYFRPAGISEVSEVAWPGPEGPGYAATRRASVAASS